MADHRNCPDGEWCPRHDLWYDADGVCPECDADEWGPDDVISLGAASPPDDWFVAEPMGPDLDDYPWPPADDVAEWEARAAERAAEELAWERGGWVPLAWLTHPSGGAN